eukprot:scaffold94607_cov56-Attheya_sp.AAC.10
MAYRPTSNAMTPYNGGGSGAGAGSRTLSPLYQIDFTAVASGKRIASTKRREFEVGQSATCTKFPVKTGSSWPGPSLGYCQRCWSASLSGYSSFGFRSSCYSQPFRGPPIFKRFGFANVEALSNGETGTACRGEEHDITLVWSVTSGKRLILADGQEVHYSNSRNALFEFSWTMRGNHVLKVVAHASPPMAAVPGFRQYDFFVDGQSFFSFPKVYRLGLSQPSSSRGQGQGYANYAVGPTSPTGIGSLEAPHNPAEEEMYLREAIKNSLVEDTKEPSENGTSSASGQPAKEEPNLLDFFDTPVPAPAPPPALAAPVPGPPAFAGQNTSFDAYPGPSPSQYSNYGPPPSDNMGFAQPPPAAPGYGAAPPAQYPPVGAPQPGYGFPAPAEPAPQPSYAPPMSGAAASVVNGQNQFTAVDHADDDRSVFSFLSAPGPSKSQPPPPRGPGTLADKAYQNIAALSDFNLTSKDDRSNPFDGNASTQPAQTLGGMKAMGAPKQPKQDVMRSPVPAGPGALVVSGAQQGNQWTGQAPPMGNHYGYGAPPAPGGYGQPQQQQQAYGQFQQQQPPPQQGYGQFQQQQPPPQQGQFQQQQPPPQQGYGQYQQQPPPPPQPYGNGQFQQQQY